MAIVVVNEAPRAEEYCALRLAAGLSAKSLAAAQVGLVNSLFSVVIRDGQTLIGMGRVVGDGACFFQVVDIAVDPAYQGQGFGATIMQHVEDYLQSVAMEGSYASLIADKPGFYAARGWQLTSPSGEGMYKRLA